MVRVQSASTAGADWDTHVAHWGWVGSLDSLNSLGGAAAIRGSPRCSISLERIFSPPTRPSSLYLVV